MNSSKSFEEVGKEGILEKSVLTQKFFRIDNMNYEYQNKFTLSILDPSNEPHTKLTIKNQLCEQNGNNLRKITQIRYKEKIYTIEDNYKISCETAQNSLNYENYNKKSNINTTSTNDSEKSDNKDDNLDQKKKKVYIFKKIRKRRILKLDGLTPRNTKNVPKNFCKAFLLFLKSQKSRHFDRMKVLQAISKYHVLLQGKKYNNKLIKKLISNPAIRDIFHYFLENESKNWINDSKVNDKKLHEEAVEIYLNLYNAPPSSNNQQNNGSSENNQSDNNERKGNL